MLNALFYPTPCYAHRVRRNPHLLKRLQNLEAIRGRPLQIDDPAFPTEDIEWITETGLHFVIDDETKTLVFATRIT